jgi:hypothetical protein
MHIKDLTSLIKLSPDAGAPTDSGGAPPVTPDVTPSDPVLKVDPVEVPTPAEPTSVVPPTDTTNTEDGPKETAEPDADGTTSWLDKYKDVDEAYRPAEGDEALATMLSTHGLDIADLNKEFITDGKFSAETIATLKAQLPPALVDLQLANMEDALELANLRNRYASDQIQTRTNDVLGVFGGEEGFGKFNEWASKALKQPEIDAINRVLEDGTMPHEIRMATVQAYAQRMSEDPAVSNAPLMKGGQGNFAPAGGNALSQEEHRSKMTDPKYGVDLEWTSQIDARRQKGIDLEGQMFGVTEHVQPAHLRHKGTR